MLCRASQGHESPRHERDPQLAQAFPSTGEQLAGSALPANEPAAVEIGLNAAIISMANGEPHVLTISPKAPDVTPSQALSHSHSLSLPSGPFEPLKHRTLEIGLRDWVKDQAKLDLGYAEQLYTFGDRGRHAMPEDTGLRVVSIGYLALTRLEVEQPGPAANWRNLYCFFPWEDWRAGKPPVLEQMIEPSLADWASRPKPKSEPLRALNRRERLRICFGHTGGWDEEKVLERYELMYEAGLVREAARDGREAAQAWSSLPDFGIAMQYDHRRILATAMGRLRGKLKYRPVIFELMPENFTLFELQKVVEAILGSYLHKQNFRRLVETGGLVEPTSAIRAQTGGRPARVFRFRRSVLLERPAPGFRVKTQQAGRIS